MYFPLLRAKQFELLALRELSHFLSQNKQKISPIIEPVKESNSTFKTTLHTLADQGVNFNIVLNPLVGEFKNSPQSVLKSITEVLSGYSDYQFALYNQNISSINDIVRVIDSSTNTFGGFTVIHTFPHPDASYLSSLGQYGPIKYNLIDQRKTNKRYYRLFEQETRVTLDDPFKLLSKNSEYITIPEEPFTEEHLFYKEDGYIGFGDYLTIGEPYAESGFMPYAVVIHITFKHTGDRIWVHHFVSDSNDDASDVAGKFSEALSKLITWINQTNVDSTAIREFRRLYESQHFPGLGVIKKLSIMHHLELVLNLI